MSKRIITTKKRNGRIYHKIICIDCGKTRWVATQNWGEVKRCRDCEYEKRRQYNTDYIRKSRKKRSKECHQELHQKEKGVKKNV